MNDARELTFAEIEPNAVADFNVAVTADLIRTFADLSGDKNPLHLDAAYAQNTELKEPIAHGMFIGALFSRLIGMYLPGKYALYLAQSLKFKTPIYIGTELKIKGAVTSKSDFARTISIRTTAENPLNGEVFVEGEALVKLLK